MATTHVSRSAAIRARVNHPIIDSDGHTLEFEPAFLDYLRQVGGPTVVERYLTHRGKMAETALSPSKARVLTHFGYSAAHWQQLQSDIRRVHLKADVEVMRQTPYGMRYEIRAPLQTPGGRALMIRTIWQVDAGTDFPRLITLFPD